MSINNIYKYILFLTAVSATINAAQLTLSSKTERFLTSLSSRSIDKKDEVIDSRCIDTALLVSRPPVYEISFREVSAEDISQLAVKAGIPDSLRKFAGYDKARGIIYYNSPHTKYLSDESEKALDGLKEKALSIIDKLLGKESRLFVFANTETDWAMEKSGDEPKRIMQTYRFTRKVNGSHIIDNTAYIRITFTGNGELCGFEIRNPVLKPMRCERMVKLSSTKERLEQLAKTKNSVHSPLNEEIKISSIIAENAIYSYVVSPGTNRLIPAISVWCKYNLENGEFFEKFETFILDASQVSNIDDEMLETSKR